MLYPVKSLRVIRCLKFYPLPFTLFPLLHFEHFLTIDQNSVQAKFMPKVRSIPTLQKRRGTVMEVSGRTLTPGWTNPTAWSGAARTKRAAKRCACPDSTAERNNKKKRARTTAVSRIFFSRCINSNAVVVRTLK